MRIMRKANLSRRLLTIVVMVALFSMIGFVTSICLNTEGPAMAKTKKVGKVKGLKVSVKGTKVTLKWKKAKNAKKYEIQRKIGNAGWKKLKKTKKRTCKSTAIVTSFKGTTCKYKVRGINGKKKGKFSAVKKKKFTTANAKKGYVSLICDPHIRVKKGRVYKIISAYGTNKTKPYILKITKIKHYDYGAFVTEGKTASGYDYYYSWDDGTEEEYITKDSKHKLFSIKYVRYKRLKGSGDSISGAGGFTTKFTIKNKKVKVYWAIDGKEPKIGQKDRKGKSVNFCDGHVSTQLAGTISYPGGTTFKTAWHLGDYVYERYVVYKGTELISSSYYNHYEQYED